MLQNIIRIKPAIMVIFWILWALILGYVYSASSIIGNPSDRANYLQAGIWFGQLAVVFFVVTVLPGILKRFGYKHTVISVLMIFRRQLGISVFLLALAHYLIVFAYPNFGTPPDKPNLILFQQFGLLAFGLMLPLFLTSNDYSLRKFGRYWKTIHKLIYIIIWLVFLHLFFQRINIWTYLIGAAAFFQIASLIYEKIRSFKLDQK